MILAGIAPRLIPSYDHIVPFALGIGIAPAIVNGKVAPLYPTDLFKRLPKRRDIGLRFCIVVSESRQHSDPAHSGRLLRARRERPRRRSTAQQRNELASS